MHEWPSDPELSRLYREVPLPESSAALRERVMAAARNHAAHLTRRQSPPVSMQEAVSAWWRNWWVPTGAFATLAVAVVVVSQFSHNDGGTPILAVPDKVAAAPDVAAEPPSEVSLPHDIRMAEVEPAQTINRPAAAQAVDTEPPSQATMGMPDDEQDSHIQSVRTWTVEQQLGELRRLKQSGDELAYRRQREQFMRTHPHYLLPKELNP